MDRGLGTERCFDLDGLLDQERRLKSRTSSWIVTAGGDERVLVRKMPGHHSFPLFQRRSALCDAQHLLPSKIVTVLSHPSANWTTQQRKVFKYFDSGG